jgi:hypothetical protein
MVSICSAIEIDYNIPDKDNDTEYWGLFISVGIYADDYSQNRPLMLEEVDAFYDVLIESPWWYDDHIRVIKGKNATIRNIINGFKWLDKMEDSNDISVIYITTHGFPVGKDIPPFDESDGTDEALVSYWGFAYKNLFIWDDELNFLLNNLESQGVCLIVDSCYAGGFNDPPDWHPTTKTYSFSLNNFNSKQNDERIKRFVMNLAGQGRVVLMASCEDEVSYSGGFAPYLIDGLSGYGNLNDDDIISAEEVFYYVEPRTIRQHPTMYDGYPGELPLVKNSLNSHKKDSENVSIPAQATKRNRVIRKSIFNENPKICGYITDNNTGIPIDNVYIDVLQGDYWDGFWSNTISDSSGFYSINVEPGDVRVFASVKEYINFRSDRLVVNENEILWINISLDFHPAELSKIYGYVIDKDSGDPIEDVYVYLEWGTSYRGYWNETTTDSTGFFIINAAGGRVELAFEKQAYITYYTQDFRVYDSDTIWVNVSMILSPVENSRICGYVTDSKSNAFIENAYIFLDWNDDNGSYLEYEVLTDSDGFYSIDIPAGETYLFIYAQNYIQKSTFRNDVADNEIFWKNISLEPDLLQIDILKPLQAFYIDNLRIFPNSNCFIIGSIEIEVYVHDFWYRERDDITRIEFYIDNELKETVYSKPFKWFCIERLTGKHHIKVIAYDKKGNLATDEISIQKLF